MRMVVTAVLVLSAWLGRAGEDVAELLPVAGQPVIPATAAPNTDDVNPVRVLIETLRTEQQQTRRLAVLAEIEDLGAKAVEAAPALIDVAQHERDPRCIAAALRALASIGPAAHASEPQLLGMLANRLEWPPRRAGACEALSAITPESPQTRRALIAAAGDWHPMVRRAGVHAALILAMPSGTGSGRETKAIYPPALEVIARAALNESACEAAAPALLTLGANGIEPLSIALKTGGPSARTWAAQALGRMRLHAAVAFPILANALRTETAPGVRVVLARSAALLRPRDPEILLALGGDLARIPEPAKAAAQSDESEMLTKLWTDVPDTESILFAAGAAALPALRKEIGLQNPAARQAVLRILERFVAAWEKHAGGAGFSAVPPSPEELAAEIAALLKNPDEASRGRALELLARLGPPARAAVPAVEALLRGACSPELRRAARLTRANLQRLPDASPCRSPLDNMPVDALLAALTAPSAEERTEAAVSLRLHGGGADVRVPVALIEALQSPDAPLRRAAAESLGCCGAAAQPAVATLSEWFHAEPKSRLAALRALAELSAAVPEARTLALHAAVENPWPEEERFTVALGGIVRGNFSAMEKEIGAFLDVSDTATRTRAARMLGLADKLTLDGGSPLLRRLIELGRDSADETAVAAFTALGRVDGAALAEATQFLADETRTSLFAARRLAALRALCESARAHPREAGELCAERLCDALNDDDEQVSGWAFDSLTRNVEPGRGRLLLLASHFDANRPHPSHLAGLLLARADIGAAELVPLLNEHLRHAATRAERVHAAALLAAYLPRHPEIAGGIAEAGETLPAVLNNALLEALLRAGTPAVNERFLFHARAAVRERAALLVNKSADSGAH